MDEIWWKADEQTAASVWVNSNLAAMLLQSPVKEFQLMSRDIRRGESPKATGRDPG